MRRKSNISKRCMVCIMSAMMMMSSVTGTMIAPIGAYAQDYATIGDMTADENGKYNLAEGDTLDTNTGTIHENNGIIKDNAAGATVEINNNEIQKNEGTVVENATGATVGAQNIEGAGTVTNNYGTAEKSNVKNNYGTAKDSIVKDNYGNAKDSHVNSNWSSGTVTGISSVTHEYGGNVADTVDVTEYNDPNPGPNPPAVNQTPGQKSEPDPASETDPGNSNDDPTPPSVITDPTSNLNAAVNGLSDAGWNGTNIVLSGDKVLTLEKLAELECESSGYADVFGKGFKTRYEQAFLKAISEGKNVAEARTIAREAADKEIATIVKKIDDNIRSDYLTLAGLSGESVTLDENNPDYMNFVAAYNKAFWGACDEGATLEDAQRIAWRDSIFTVNQNAVYKNVFAHLINKGESLMLAVSFAKQEGNAIPVYNLSDEEGYNEFVQGIYISAYLNAFQKAMDEKKTISEAISDAKAAGLNAAEGAIRFQEKLKKQEEVTRADRERTERGPQTAAITNANAAIAQANTSVKSAVTEDAAYFAAVVMQCDNYLIETNALIAEGKIDEANALIAKGLTINAGTHQGFNAATLAKIGEASRMGIATTVNFTFGSANYSVTIPGNSQIDPATLVDENGYCNFLNLLKYFT